MQFDMIFSAEEAELFQSLQTDARVILEYTAGATTLLAASRPGKYVITVEGHRHRAIALQMEIDAAGYPSPALIWHVDPSRGSAGAMGFANSVWLESFFRHPDLIVLRGPMKSACLLAVMLKIVRPVAVLFEGWSGNPQRTLIERLVSPTRIVGNMAELRLMPTGGRPAMQELLLELCRTAETVSKAAIALSDGYDGGAESIESDQGAEEKSPLVGLNSRKSLDLPPWASALNYAKAPKAVLVIASQPRCGSHMLGQALAKDGRFGMPLEYLHPRHWESWEKRCGTKATDRIVEEMIRFRTSSAGVFSVKAHWSQFKKICNLGLEDFFRDARYVFLTRRDLLGQSISFEIARQTGAWAAEQQIQIEPRFRARRIRETMTEILLQRSGWERYRATSGILGIDLTYEDILEDPKKAIKRVARLVSLPDQIADASDQPMLPTKVQRGRMNNEWRSAFLRTMDRASKIKVSHAK